MTGSAIGRTIGTMTGVAAFALLLALLPRHLPGELRDAALARPDTSLCAGCPQARRIEAAGGLDEGTTRTVTIRFAAPPSAAAFDLLLEGRDGVLTFSQRIEDDQWLVASAGSTGAPGDLRLGAAGTRLVLELPAGLAGSGLAIRAPDGTRLPADGWLPFQAPPARHANLFDVVLLLVVLGSLWWGWRLGAAVGLLQLASIVVVLAAGRLLTPAVASAIGLSGTPAGRAVAFGATVGVIGLAVRFALGRAGADWLRGLRRLTGGAGVDRALGGPCQAVRALLLAAMILTMGADLAVVDAVNPMLTTSLSAPALTAAWHAVVGP
ncbi:MAG: CvpA family protein [Vicinamibacterales bacterium]